MAPIASSSFPGAPSLRDRIRSISASTARAEGKGCHHASPGNADHHSMLAGQGFQRIAQQPPGLTPIPERLSAAREELQFAIL